MKHILCKPVLLLLCALLIACSPVVTAFAQASGDSMNQEQPVADPVPTETPAASEAPPPETTPPVESTPPAESTPPPKGTDGDVSPPNYGVTLFWPWGGQKEGGPSGISYERVWNPNAHCYDGWKSENNSITVTNDSTNGSAILVTLSFLPGGGGVPMAFAPGEEDPAPEDFTMGEDGRIEFVLPRPSGETSVDVFLWPVGDWTGGDSEDYQEVGLAQSTFVAISGVSAPDSPEPTEAPRPAGTPEPTANSEPTDTPEPTPELSEAPPLMPEPVELPLGALDFPPEMADPLPPPADEGADGETAEQTTETPSNGGSPPKEKHHKNGV